MDYSCLIEAAGDEKYIIVKIEKEDSSKYILYSTKLSYHSQIYSRFKSRYGAEGAKITVEGGGIIVLDTDQKKVFFSFPNTCFFFLWVDYFENEKAENIRTEWKLWETKHTSSEKLH